MITDMDSQNLTARSFAPGHHEQVLPMLAKPAAWTCPTTTPPTTSPTPPSTASSTANTSNIASASLEQQNPSPPPATTGITGTTQNPNAISKLRKPRKANNAGGRSSSTLFWVHTDPQSASEGTREETLKRIRSHVMSEHNRKKRENTKRYSSSKTWKHLAFQPVETTATAAVGNGGGKASSRSPPARGKSSPGAKRTSPTATTEKVDDSPGTQDEVVNAIVKDTADVVAAQPWTYLGQGAKDPFSMAHTQLSDRMFHHLQNFLSNLTHQAYPLQHRSGPKLEAHWASLVRDDPASLHASICVAASSTALQTGEFPIIDPSKQASSALVIDAFHHRGETIRLVNEGLSDPIKAASDELIAAVSILLTIEIASGNPDYVKIHLAGLRQMVALRSSFADVPPDVRFQISWTDIRVACMAFTKPIFPFLRSPRPTTFSVIPPTDEISLLASRFISLIETSPGTFGPEMYSTIYDLRELTWYAEWIKGPQSQAHNFTDETEDYFNNEVLHVEYSLHRDRYTPAGQAKGDASLEGCVRLACLLFHNTAIWDFYPMMGPVFNKPIAALRMALESTIAAGDYHNPSPSPDNQERGKGKEDLLIWLLFIGTCSSQILPSERSFFINGLAAAVRMEGIGTWQELRGLLMRFYYVDRKYLGVLRGVWDEIMSMSMSYDPEIGRAHV